MEHSPYFVEHTSSVMLDPEFDEFDCFDPSDELSVEPVTNNGALMRLQLEKWSQ